MKMKILLWLNVVLVDQLYLLIRANALSVASHFQEYPMKHWANVEHVTR
jgi:hypothetical protein